MMIRVRQLILASIALVVMATSLPVGAATPATMPPFAQLPTWCQLVVARTGCAPSTTGEIATSLAQPVLPIPLRSFDLQLYGGTGPTSAEDNGQLNCEGYESVVSKSSYVPCSYGQRSSRRVIVVTGDSEAESWIPAFDVWGQQNGFRIVMLAFEGCPPWYYNLPASNKNSQWSACLVMWRHKVATYLATTRPVAVVATGMHDVAQGTSAPTTSTAALVTAMRSFFTTAVPAGTIGIALTNYPWFFSNPQLPMTCAEVHAASLSQCNATVSNNVDAAYRSAFLQIGNLHLPHTVVVDTLPLFCNITTAQCPTVGSNAFLYIDSHHVSTVWSWHVGRALSKLLAPILSTPAS